MTKDPNTQPGPIKDKREADAKAALEEFFDRNVERVFYSKQLEVLHENDWFHWITNRALRDLVDDGKVAREVRELRTGGAIHLMWHRSYRYHRREAARLVELVEQYSDSNIGAALGLQVNKQDFACL